MLFDKFINRVPLDHKVLGDLALGLGEYDRALKHYKKEEYNYFNTKDNNCFNIDDIGDVYLIEEIYEKIIDIYLYKEDYENAIKYSKKIIENDESHEYVNKGASVIELSKLYVLSGQSETAVETLEDLLKYELDEIESDPDDDYPKKLYMGACYELINILKYVDKSQSQKYLDLAMDMYHKNSQADLGTEMADILKLQSEFYKKSLPDKNLSEDDLKTVEQICRNYILASEIYIKEYEEKKARRAIKEGIKLYKKFNLDNFKLHFDLRYQLACVDDESYRDIDEEISYNDYMKAFKILKENKFFDEYRKNVILDKLAYYCDDFELARQYRNQCNYSYIADYKVEHSENWIEDFISEYEDAARSYNSCQNYDMAIKCYKKAIDNLSGCGLFTGEFYEEEENLKSKSIYISYTKYINLCKDISRVYERKKEYDQAIKYLNMAIDCVNKYCNELKSYEYSALFYIYEEIAQILNKKRDFENSINNYLFLIGAFNSQNLENNVNQKYDDIEYLFNLLNMNKIKDYILSEEFTIDLASEWINRVEYICNDLLKIAENIENKEIIEFCREKLDLIKDTPFDI